MKKITGILCGIPIFFLCSVALAMDKEIKPQKSWLDNIAVQSTLATNYMYRGLSQTRNKPAVQGGLTYTFPIGIYLNAWGSNVDLMDSHDRQATVELDAIAGWRGNLGPVFTDINYDRYFYPGAQGLSYNELNTLWTYKIFTLGFSYSGNVYNTHKSGFYYSGQFNFPIQPKYFLNFEGLTLGVGMGHSTLPRINGSGFSYNDYNVTINKKLSEIFLLTLQGTATNGRAHVPPLDRNQLLAMITANF